MDEKKQKRLINRSLKLLNGKNKQKIRSFLDLAQVLKISKNTLQNYGLNKHPEIVELIKQNRHAKVQRKKIKKQCKKVLKNSPQNEVKISNKNDLLRPYGEIKAKLFGYKAWKQKNYNKIPPSAKTVIDRQIALLEWVMNENKENKEGDENGIQNNTGM